MHINASNHVPTMHVTQCTDHKCGSVVRRDAIIQLTVVEELVGDGTDMRMTSVLGVKHRHLVTLST